MLSVIQKSHVTAGTCLTHKAKIINLKKKKSNKTWMCRKRSKHCFLSCELGLNSMVVWIIGLFKDSASLAQGGAAQSDLFAHSSVDLLLARIRHPQLLADFDQFLFSSTVLCLPFGAVRAAGGHHISEGSIFFCNPAFSLDSIVSEHCSIAIIWYYLSNEPGVGHWLVEGLTVRRSKLLKDRPASESMPKSGERCNDVDDLLVEWLSALLTSTAAFLSWNFNSDGRVLTINQQLLS